MTVVGVISDTHGLLRPSAIAALQGCDFILHAGDVGKQQVLDALRALAPVTAVRGNVDLAWARALPDAAHATIAGRRFLLIHDLKRLEIDPRAAGFDVVISGHSHQPAIRWLDGVLYVNPGSAGPRRFRLPVALARVEIRDGSLEAHIVDL